MTKKHYNADDVSLFLNAPHNRGTGVELRYDPLYPNSDVETVQGVIVHGPGHMVVHIEDITGSMWRVCSDNAAGREEGDVLKGEKKVGDWAGLTVINGS